MPDRVVPFLRLAVLSRRIEVHDASQSIELIDPIHTISLPAASFGQPLAAMFLYLQLEDAVGAFDFSVRVEDENGRLVPQPNLVSREHRFEGAGLDRIIPFEMVLEFGGLVLPAPGVYHFIVRADTQSLHQGDSAARSPLLRVLPLDTVEGV
jgi:hypothetical protein